MSAPGPRAPEATRGARTGTSWHGLAGLGAGLLLLDVLLNLPAFSADSPAASLLAPSIDLLVLVAICWGIAQAGPGARLPLRIGFAAVAVGLLVCAAGLRWGWDAAWLPAGWVLGTVIAAAAGIAAFALSRLVVSGLEPPLVRSVLLLVVALAAVLQVVSGHKVFTASVIPRLFALIR